MKTQPEIPWKGELRCDDSLKLLEPEIEMRIPAGGEFVDPKPPRSNHFSNIFVFHKASKTIHNDDNWMVANDPGFLLRLFGMKDGKLSFHRSIMGPGLFPTKEAPWQYKKWVQDIVNDWDFVNLCTAHNGNAIGNAKELLNEALVAFEPKFQEISDRNKDGKPGKDEGPFDPKDENPHCG